MEWSRARLYAVLAGAGLAAGLLGDWFRDRSEGDALRSTDHRNQLHRET